MYFPPEKMAVKVELRLLFEGEMAALAALPVPSIDNGGAYALHQPIVLVVLADKVVIDGLAFIVYHVHGPGLLSLW